MVTKAGVTGEEPASRVYTRLIDEAEMAGMGAIENGKKSKSTDI